MKLPSLFLQLLKDFQQVELLLFAVLLRSRELPETLNKTERNGF